MALELENYRGKKKKKKTKKQKTETRKHLYKRDKICVSQSSKSGF